MATGSRVNHLRNTTPFICSEIARLTAQMFTSQFATARAEEQAKKAEIQGARPKASDLEMLQAAVSLYHNFVLPKIRETRPAIEKLVEADYQSLRLTEDLYRVSLGRSSADLGNSLSLQERDG